MSVGSQSSRAKLSRVDLCVQLDLRLDKGEGSQQKLGERPCRRLLGDRPGHWHANDAS